MSLEESESDLHFAILIYYINFDELKGEPMTKKASNTSATRRPDCVTEVRMGNTILTVSGYLKLDAKDTATDKMMRVLEAEAVTKPGNIA